MNIKRYFSGIFLLVTLSVSGCGESQSSSFKLTVDEKVTTYNLEQRIRAGASPKQLEKAAIDVLVTGENFSAPARIYQMEVEGEGRTVAVLHVMFPTLTGDFALQYKGWDLDILVDNSPEALNSRKGEREAVEASTVWDVLFYRQTYGGLNVDQVRQIESAQRAATLFGIRDGKEVRLYKIGNPFPRIASIDLNRQTVKLATVQAGILWSGANHYHRFNDSFHGPSGSFQGITDKCVLYFVESNNRDIGHATRCFPLEDETSLASQSRRILKQYPELLAKAQKLAAQP